MRTPYRTNAPPPPDFPDEEEPYAKVLRAQRTRGHVILGMVVVAITLGAVRIARSTPRGRARAGSSGAEASEQSRAKLASVAIGAARERANTSQASFEKGLRDAIDSGAEPRPDLGRCPVELPNASALVRGRAAFPLLTVRREELATVVPSQAVGAVLSDIRRAERHLASGHYEEAALYARALDRQDRFGYDVVLVATKQKHPHVVTGAEFVPGETEGRAYVYEFASGRVVCAADIHVKSSASIGYMFSDRADAPASMGAIASMNDALEEDLRLETERAIVRAMKWSAGPRS